MGCDDASVITIHQGTSSAMAWPITTDGQPADLTGHTAKCEVRSASSGAGALLATITAAVAQGTTAPTIGSLRVYFR